MSNALCNCVVSFIRVNYQHTQNHKLLHIYVNLTSSHASTQACSSYPGLKKKGGGD